MKNKRLWVSVIAGMMAAVLVLSLVIGVLPRKADAASSSELKEQLDELQAQKDALSQQIADLEKQQSENRDNIEGILAQKDIIDQQVALLHAEVNNITNQINAYNLLIADKQEELEEAQARLDELNELNKERIRAMEEQGALSYWSVLFQANDFADLLDRVNMVQEIAAADQRRLEEMKEVAEEVRRAQQILEEEKAALEVVKAELTASQDELAAKNDEADALLAELIQVSDDLQDIHNQFEQEEEAFLDELLKVEHQYSEQLAYEESSRQESIQESIQASIQESIQESIDASIEASIQESIRESIEESRHNATAGTAPGINGSHDSNVDADGIRWITPTTYSYVSSPFGYRWHPVTGQYTMHNGVDLPAPKGTPIYATRSGVVTIATSHSTAGNYVTINHQDGYTSVYMHMTHYVVYRGDYVKAGQLIGYVGSTGRSTGPHLHFGISYMGEYVNPMDYIG
jgi:murein DD-endopeptidase MepM/ murein hydrolase activator NlpD